MTYNLLVYPVLFYRELKNIRFNTQLNFGCTVCHRASDCSYAHLFTWCSTEGKQLTRGGVYNLDHCLRKGYDKYLF